MIDKTKLQRLEESTTNGGTELPQVFAVVSWGCTATKWVATALNSLPAMFSVHSAIWYLKELMTSSEGLDDLHYLRTLRILATGHRSAGDVHGISRHSVATLREFFGDSFRAAVLVRDPVRRLRSLIHLFEEANYDEKVWTGLDYIRTRPNYPLIAHLITEPRHRFFVHAANCLNAIIEEVEVAPIYRSEDLTTDPTMFCKFVEFISAGTIGLDEQEAKKIQQMDPINSHSQGRKPIQLDQPWQIEVLRAMVPDQSWKIYEDLGYAIPAAWREREQRLTA